MSNSIWLPSNCGCKWAFVVVNSLRNVLALFAAIKEIDSLSVNSNNCEKRRRKQCANHILPNNQKICFVCGTLRQEANKSREEREEKQVMQFIRRHPRHGQIDYGQTNAYPFWHSKSLNLFARHTHTFGIHARTHLLLITSWYQFPGRHTVWLRSLPVCVSAFASHNEVAPMYVYNHYYTIIITYKCVCVSDVQAKSVKLMNYHTKYIYPIIFRSNSESESQCVLTAFHPELCIHNKRMNAYMYGKRTQPPPTTMPLINIKIAHWMCCNSKQGNPWTTEIYDFTAEIENIKQKKIYCTQLCVIAIG